MSQAISETALRERIQAWIAEGKRVWAPARIPGNAGVLYEELASADAWVHEGYVHPRNSIKEAVFPRHETLFRYRCQGKQIELCEGALPTRPQVVLGATPCDAASLPILDAVFNWDYRDARYNRRRELTTVVTLACRGCDAHCFCTDLGLGPDHPQGSDAMLLARGEGTFEVRTFTEKGEHLFAGHTESCDTPGQAASGPAKRLELAALREFLSGGFEDPRWAEWTLRCFGCGACAYTCPTCHCFDMVDERNGSGGHRVRNWDACQFQQFTLHASGHNPRANGAQRQRQRIFHKFQVYPQKFSQTLCTGCGNCTRNCPVGLGVRPVLEAIAAEAGRAEQVT